MATDWWRDFFSGVVVDFWLRIPTEEQTRGEADFIQKVLQLPDRGKLLDVPCGGGRHSLELAARGYHVTGVDLSADFLKAARAQADRTGHPVVFEQREMCDLPWQGEFDGAFCFGNSFGYLDDAGNARFLKAVARTLKPKARFVLDTGVVAESLLPAFQERRWLQVGDILYLSRGRYDHVRARLDTDYTFIRDGNVDTRPASTRVYGYRELHRMFEEAGLEGCEGYGSLDQEPFRLGSPRLLLVATKVDSEHPAHAPSPMS
jgi:SAM-dependent methyltransferase